MKLKIENCYIPYKEIINKKINISTLISYIKESINLVVNKRLDKKKKIKNLTL